MFVPYDQANLARRLRPATGQPRRVMAATFDTGENRLNPFPSCVMPGWCCVRPRGDEGTLLLVACRDKTLGNSLAMSTKRPAWVKKYPALFRFDADEKHLRSRAMPRNILFSTLMTTRRKGTFVFVSYHTNLSGRKETSRRGEEMSGNVPRWDVCCSAQALSKICVVIRDELRWPLVS